MDRSSRLVKMQLPQQTNSQNSPAHAAPTGQSTVLPVHCGPGSPPPQTLPWFVPMQRVPQPGAEQSGPRLDRGLHTFRCSGRSGPMHTGRGRRHHTHH
jgi:hypothetical protein